MTELRGRYFGFLALLCATWVAARIGFLAFEQSPSVPVLRASKQLPHIALGGAPDKAQIVKGSGPFFVCCRRKPGLRQSRVIAGHKPVASFGSNREVPANEDATAKPGAALTDLRSSRSEAIVLSQPAQKILPGRRAQFYAYSFWRDGPQTGALNSGTQYGGSQSGFVATYALRRFATKGREERLALLLRGAIAHDNLREREVATGLRWRPSQHIPFSLNAERRFRANRPDAFAAYVAGGVSEVRLPMQFHLEVFGQAGVVSGKNAGPFFDFITRADRKVVQLGTARISAGAGAWGGGQDDVGRVDIGPAVRTDIALGEANFRLSADWRFRIAGDASPANGPAVTLSTSF